MDPVKVGSEIWTYYRQWLKGPAEIRDGAVILDKDRAETYVLNAESAAEDVLFQLAAIREVRDVKSFVSRYGLLSVGPEQRDDNEQLVESLDHWRRVVLQARAIVGLYVAFDEIGEVSATSSVEVLRRLRPLIEQAFDDVPGEPRGSTECMLHYQKLFVEILRFFLNRCETNLIPAYWLQPESSLAEFVYMITPPTLQLAAYVDFANLVARQATVKRCLHCERVFHPKSGKQIYCSPAHASTNRSQRRRKKLK